ncbi:SDR family NAD(P)-dependent oxidoreductase [Paraburkholderia sp. SUR17]|uniref:SDR family NAD(P)-dependent oxidoreductase n=1 Tax=Paraburkholderia sp. SUR17 TaxID=3034358 RepID=UPI00240849F5|nr:SDR family NAD(P)-dependent oxidoreductase [Paraburkholderia sp. SUR17]WEY43076.1 SDR family NAD(P)-dependent oxidoreductase [Paraburkholderia sp. SUR17]
MPDSRTSGAFSTTTAHPPQRMAGRVCLVTGGGSGIGRATAILMAREGAAGVIVAGRRREPGDATAQACREAGREAGLEACRKAASEAGSGSGCDAHYVQADVTREADAAALVEFALARFGRLDVAFNNAGYQEPRALLEAQTRETFDAVLDANLRSVFYGLRHQIPAMLERGGGRIIVNASVSGIRNPNPGLALYSASKAAVISLVRSAAMECAPRGIRINAIAPGRVVTSMMLGSGIDPNAIAASLPVRRLGEPEEVAQAVVWLASDDASYVVGHVLAADGGFLSS